MAKTDNYQEITNQIIEQLEAGTEPWRKPWNTGGGVFPKRFNGEAYRGINILLLWVASMKKGFSRPTWMTYKQAKELGGQVKKGEKARKVVKYGTFAPKDDQGHQDDEHQIPYLRVYAVFNVDQIEGLPAEYYPELVQPCESFKPNYPLEALIRKTGAKVDWTHTRACYIPDLDVIHMPPRRSFKDEPSAYATALHELAHWTGAKHRLNRDLSGRFKTHAYAAEELIAEIGSCFLCAAHGVPLDVRDAPANYIANWLQLLKGDKKAIITAAAKAQEILDYINQLVEPAETMAA